MADTLPDRLSTDPRSPYYDEKLLERDIGERCKGVEKTNVTPNIASAKVELASRPARARTATAIR